MARLILIFILMIGVVGCRTAQRKTDVGGAVMELHVKLLNLDKADENRSDLVYLLQGCIDEQAPGVLSTDNKVIFSVRGAKLGSVCDVRILTQGAMPAQIKFLKEPGMLYQSTSGVISQATDSQRQVSAVMEKLYNPVLPADPAKIFSLAVPVEFVTAPADFAGLRAKLTCLPAIDFSGAIVSSGKATGVFTVQSTFGNNLQYSCTKIIAFLNGKLAYEADFNKSFTVSAGAKLNLSDAPIKLTPTLESKASGVTIISIEGGSICPDGKIYDIEKRLCVNP